MASDLQEQISKFTSEFLLTQYCQHAAQYTSEALAIMHREIERRRIPQEELNRYQAVPAAKTDEDPVKTIPVQDLKKIETPFSKNALLCALSILKEHAIPCTLSGPAAAAIEPSNDEIDYYIQVPGDSIEQALALLDEHLSIVDNKFTITYDSPEQKIKSFNFNEIRLTDKALNEEIEVVFTAHEKQFLIDFANRLQAEADTIESTQDRMLFYYDNLEQLIDKLAGDTTTFSRADLLSVLEIGQVYCNDESFPRDLVQSLSGLLMLFE